MEHCKGCDREFASPAALNGHLARSSPCFAVYGKVHNLSGYKGGCRCSICTEANRAYVTGRREPEAWRDYMRDYRARRRRVERRGSLRDIVLDYVETHPYRTTETLAGMVKERHEDYTLGGDQGRDW